MAEIPAAREPRATAPVEQTPATLTVTIGALKTVPAEQPATSTVEAAIEVGESMKPSVAEPESAKAKQRIGFAVNDLAQRLGVAPEATTIVSYEETVWNDGSLGCPQPGMMYTQALVPGYQVQLEVDGELYNYHGANGRDPFLCENGPSDPDSLPGP
jgi:hypothetical protein